MSTKSATKTPRFLFWVQLSLFLGLLVISIFALGPIREMYVTAIDRSGEDLVLRVIATLEQYQNEHKLATGQYAEGSFDSTKGIRSISDATGWVPSLDEGIVYTIKRVGDSGYQVGAKHPDGSSTCLQYPQKLPC